MENIIIFLSKPTHNLVIGEFIIFSVVMMLFVIWIAIYLDYLEKRVSKLERSKEK